MGGFLVSQRATYLLFKLFMAHGLIRFGGRTRSQRAKLLTAYALVISLLLVLACSRIPNPFSSVSALPIARAARLPTTPTPPRFTQNQVATDTGQSPYQAFGEAEPADSPVLGPVEPTSALVDLMGLTQTAIAGESVQNILGNLATPAAVVLALKTRTPTPTAKLPIAVEILSTPTPWLKEFLPTEEPVKPVGGAPAAAPVVAVPTEITVTQTPTATPTTEPTPTPTETPEPEAPVAGGGPAPIVGGETPTATPFGTPAPTSTVDPALITPTATPTRTPRPTRTTNPAYPTLTPIPEGAFLDIVDIRLSPATYSGAQPGSELPFEVWVEPNGQEVSVVQVVIEFDTDLLRATSSTADPDAPLTVRLVPDDTFDNDDGLIVMSVSQDKNATESPTTMFLMGTIKLEIDSSVSENTSTWISFVRFGDVRTVAGIEGAEVTDELFGSSVMIELPATPTPTPVP